MTDRPSWAVVTGAGRGLGRQLATLLADRGPPVLVADVDAATAQETADAVGPGATALAVDVRDDAQVRRARDVVVERGGRLDVWVNNAGVLRTGPAWTQDEATRRQLVEVNTLGTINGTVAALDLMRGSEATGGTGGHVINIVSLAGLGAVAGEAVYAASKHAVLGFSLSTMADLRAAGVDDVQISCVCPDGIWTPMLHDKLDDPASALSFSGRLLQPHEVVAAVGRVLDRPRLVTAVPSWRGLQVRIADAFPRLGLFAVPYVASQGRRRQRRLRARAE